MAEQLPDWVPTLSDVAVYVTSRTVTATGDDGTASDTFTTETFPTSIQVEVMLANVCSWITAQVPAVSSALSELARMTAALRTAGLIQISFPVRDGDVPNGSELLKQADKVLETLVFAAGSAATPTDVLAPLASFPPALSCFSATAGSESRRSW